MGLFDENGHLVKKTHSLSFRENDSLENTILSLEQLIRTFMVGNVDGIGIGVPSALDQETGIIYNAINIPSWRNVPLKQVLEEFFHLPVSLNNDANCFALGAYKYFSNEHPKSLVGVTLGTGVGVGIVIDGKLYNGNNTGAGEIGCIHYLDADLESYCSSHFFNRHHTTCKDAADAMRRKDPEAGNLFDAFGKHIGHLVITLLYAYDPEMLVLGGGISNAFPYFKDSMNACLEEEFIYPDILKKLKIRLLDNDEIALNGAAFL